MLEEKTNRWRPWGYRRPSQAYATYISIKLIVKGRIPNFINKPAFVRILFMNDIAFTK